MHLLYNYRLKTLKDEGLDKNTLVILTSDNGPWRRFGNYTGSSGGLREGKMTVFFKQIQNNEQ